MKASRLSFDNMIDINARTGMISVKGKRMALMSTEALGLLRRDLMITFGIEKAKNFIMQYGWVCGFNDAEIMESRTDWDSKDEIFLAGPAMHTLEGFVTAEAYIKEVKNGIPLFHGFWWNSFEAEEHIKHFGITEETVCWMLVGYANGYAAKLFGNEQVLIYEKTCRAKGDEYCSFENKFVGDSIVDVLEKVDTKYNKSSRNEFDRIYLEVSQLNKDLLEVEEIQKRLNQLILEDKTPLDIIQYAATVLNCSIIYKNKDAEKIACFKMNEEEKILRDWMKAGEPSSTIINKRYVDSFHIHGSKYFGNLVVIGEKSFGQ